MCGRFHEGQDSFTFQLTFLLSFRSLRLWLFLIRLRRVLMRPLLPHLRYFPISFSFLFFFSFFYGFF